MAQNTGSSLSQPTEGMPKHDTHRGQKYLQLIEAPRGYAILWVLLFHFWPSTVTGGFVGVDVFFVNSGGIFDVPRLMAP